MMRNKQIPAAAWIFSTIPTDLMWSKSLIINKCNNGFRIPE